MVDTTTTTETTTDLSTSERFSLKQESENTVKEDINAKAGANVSSKYGNTQFSANASFDYSNSKNDSQKVSSDYARDVTSRASIKVTESIRVQQTTHVLETFEEDEHHSFDNTAGTENVSGIYQWVNKVYRAQIFNYGKRLLFDIMVPEPAGLLLDAANISTQTGMPQPPTPFTAMPSDLTYLSSTDPKYYGRYLAEYDVEGLDPPPLDNVSLTKTFTLAIGDKDFYKGTELSVPQGYESVRAYANVGYNYTTSDPTSVDVFIGDVRFQWKGKTQTLPISPQLLTNGYATLGTPCVSKIGVVVAASPECAVGDYAVIVEIDCTPTASSIQSWQLKTHSKILGAYYQKLRDYQDNLASRKMNPPATGPLGNNNPDANRITERTELKRGAIQLLTQQDLLEFNDVTVESATGSSLPGDSPPQLFPRPNYNQAVQDGAFARFFEQAFE